RRCLDQQCRFRSGLFAALAFRPARLAVLVRATLAIAAAMVAVLAFALLLRRARAIGALAGCRCAAFGGCLAAFAKGLARRTLACATCGGALAATAAALARLAARTGRDDGRRFTAGDSDVDAHQALDI